MVSFVVAVRDDEGRLRPCLDSIARSGYLPERIEVVVADNGSRDGSRDVARAAGATVLELPGLGVAALRNRAAAAAQGQILAFVDADHEIDPAWVESAVETLSAPGVAAAGAACHPPPGGTRVQRAYDDLRWHGGGLHEVAWLGSGNMAVLREAFDAVGGFDETLEACEDVDLCNRLRARGGTLMNDDRMRNIHFGDPPTLGALFRSELWRGRGNLRVSLRAGSLRDLLGAAIPVLNLLCHLAAVAGLALVPVVGWVPALAGMAGVAGFALLRALRMSRFSPVGLAVAATFESARALAPVLRAPHRRAKR